MDNKTFLETIVSYFRDGKLGIRIYHPSSVYFYGYPLTQEYIKPFFYFYYFKNFLDFNKGELSYYLGPHISFDQYIAEPSVLNDFVKFKLKIYPDTITPKIHIFYAYRKEDIAADTIKSAWKKHRWNYLRNLAAVKYHPSKIDFTI